MKLDFQPNKHMDIKKIKKKKRKCELQGSHVGWLKSSTNTCVWILSMWELKILSDGGLLLLSRGVQCEKKGWGKHFNSYPGFAQHISLDNGILGLTAQAAFGIRASAIISKQIITPVFCMKAYLTSTCQVFIVHIRPHANFIHSLMVLDVHSFEIIEHLLIR